MVAIGSAIYFLFSQPFSCIVPYAFPLGEA